MRRLETDPVVITMWFVALMREGDDTVRIGNLQKKNSEQSKETLFKKVKMF